MNWKPWSTWRSRMPCGNWCSEVGWIAKSWRGAIFIAPPSAGGARGKWAARQAQQRPEDDLAAAMVLFYSLLDEQQRRLYAGLESLEWGHGGDQRRARLFGLDPDTIARGRLELLSGQVLQERVRRVGGGRPRVEKKRPKSCTNC